MNPIVFICIFAAMIFVTNEVFDSKKGKKATVVKYIDIPTDEYDEHQGGVPDIVMQTSNNAVCQNFAWSYLN